jgi:Fe-S-cluster containining protein
MGPVEEYLNLRQRIDREAERLVALHGMSITCSPSCDGCCVNLTVFPVEFFSIEQEMRRAGLSEEDLHFDESAICGFLRDRLCRIYPFRPIICRTHGLPILFIDDSSDESRWEVSFCERNFRDRDQIEFTNDMLLDIENINAELNRINRDFIASLPEGQYESHTRIPLKELCSAKTKSAAKDT